MRYIEVYFRQQSEFGDSSDSSIKYHMVKKIGKNHASKCVYDVTQD